MELGGYFAVAVVDVTVVEELAVAELVRELVDELGVEEPAVDGLVGEPAVDGFVAEEPVVEPLKEPAVGELVAQALEVDVLVGFDKFHLCLNLQHSLGCS